ncbi:hypothetical protein BKA56DRAFT_660381 [Ilyonectria sp. MPI-CAGE-AT-0026]|nr:hypothetical protein BKA56DRAFT_660381 [Ilyonectria sp. MPI-CAGE-AT-0026]
MARLLAFLAYCGAFATVAADAVTETNLKIYPSGYWFYQYRSLDASIVDVNKDMTTFALRCPPADATELYCDFDEKTLTYGPTVMEFTTIESAETMIAEFDSTFIYNPHCTRVKTDGSPDTVTCTVEMTGESSGVLVESTISTVYSKYLTSSMNIAVTAGASKLKGQETATPGASATETATDTATDTETTVASSSSDNSTVSKTADASAGSSFLTSVSKVESTGSEAASTSGVTSAGSEAESTGSEATPTANNTDNAAGPINTHNAALMGMAVMGVALLL